MRNSKGQFVKGESPWNKGVTTGIRHDKQFRDGHIPWNKGIKSWVKPWLGKKRPDMLGELNNEWKGDEVGYVALHEWVQSKLGKPLSCTECGKESENSRMFHWHNISGKYMRDIKDWLRVCAKCHKKLHKNNE